MNFDNEIPMEEKLLQPAATITAALLQDVKLNQPLDVRLKLVTPVFQMVYSNLQDAGGRYSMHNGKISFAQYLQEIQEDIARILKA